MRHPCVLEKRLDVLREGLIMNSSAPKFRVEVGLTHLQGNSRRHGFHLFEVGPLVSRQIRCSERSAQHESCSCSRSDFGRWHTLPSSLSGVNGLQESSVQY